MDNMYITFLYFFRSSDLLLKFRDYSKKCHPILKIPLKEKKNGKLSFLDVDVFVMVNHVCHGKPNVL